MEDMPNHPNVKAVRAAGYKVVMRHSSMPVVYRAWLVQQHNSKHGGCRSTFLEMLMTAEEAEASWGHE